MFEPQTGGPFSNASVSGDYVLGMLPSLLLSSPVSGVVTANGAGSPNGTLHGKGGSQSFTGSHSVAANGRATLAITPSVGPPSNMVFYLISPSKAVGIRIDAGTANTASQHHREVVGIGTTPALNSRRFAAGVEGTAEPRRVDVDLLDVTAWKENAGRGS